MEQEKLSISAVLIVILTFIAYIFLDYWLKANHFDFTLPGQTILVKINQKAIAIRFSYVLLFGLSVILASFNSRITSNHTKYSLLLSALCLSFLLIIGCIGIRTYDLIIYPIIFFAFLPITYLAIASFKGNIQSDDSIFGVTNEKSDFYFNFYTSEKKELTVHVPQQNFWIDGGAGSGKSDTFIKSIIEQCAQRNYAGLIYDWEGDPTKKGNPILSKVAYGCIQEYKSSLNFAFINFTDMLRTNRVNVFAEKYIPRGSEALFIRNVIITLMKNLEPSWKEKTDFWANNAINYVYSIAYKCFKERDKEINTLPHVIAIALNDSNAVFEWLSEDNEISLNMSSMLTAWKMGAHQQTAGAVSSAQTPLAMLNNKNIFWVLSKDELNLDITNKESPTLLCIGNAPMLKDAISPAISCILSVVMSQMNNPDKNKSVFLVDELPTININGIDNFISTARKHFVSTILAVQDFNQAIRDYGEKSAKILKGSCGSQFYGMTGNDDTAKAIQELLGENKELQMSYTTQESGSGSQSESLQNQKVVKSRDIAGQRTGHFIGKVANGKPPFFNEQFNRVQGYELEIPEFSVVVDTKDPKKNIELQDAIIQSNYDNIIMKVNELLKPYKK